MPELKFDKEICENCETIDCLVRCQYLKLDLEAARREKMKIINGEDSEVLHQCATCYGCEEYCPWGNHPFYLIVKRQEERGVLPAPRPIINQQIKMYAPKGDPRVGDLTDLVVDMCLFPQFKNSAQGRLFPGASLIMGRDFFCNLVYLHYGNHSVILERAQKIIANIAGLGIRELVCFHDECYGLYASYAPAFGLEVPFKPVHLFEHLFNQLKKHEREIKKLDLLVAYQRPCSSRLTPQKEHFLDDIFDLIGVKRVEREYDRENPLCCGAVIRMQGRDDLADDIQKRNIEDIAGCGAEVCVFNCPMCYVTLGEMVAQKGVRPVMITELCRLALGEKLEVRR